MAEPLITYLHDHLAGSHFAIELLDSLCEQYGDEPLGRFARELSVEIKSDQSKLEEIIQHTGTTRFTVAEAAGWLAEKASELKLGRDKTGRGLGTFEALETLALGIQGKAALWRALPVIREIDSSIPAFDFDQLTRQAEYQFRRVEEQRLSMARVTFQPQAGKIPGTQVTSQT